MGKAMELLTGFVTAPSTTLTALTMSDTDSLVVRSFNAGKSARMLTNWTDSQGLGLLQVRSPRWHDNVNGVEIATQISEVQPLMPLGNTQEVYSQDAMTALLSGSATAGDIETACLLMQYDDLDGINQRLIDGKEMRSRMRGIMISRNVLALGTAGGYSGSQVINTTVDNWKATDDYALIGYQTTVECANVWWRGSDTGNLRVGGPGHENFKTLTGNWFEMLSDTFNMPLIPVFNASNKANIFIGGAQDENGADPTVTSIFAWLK